MNDTTSELDKLQSVQDYTNNTEPSTNVNQESSPKHVINEYEENIANTNT